MKSLDEQIDNMRKPDFEAMGAGEIVNPHVVSLPPEPTPDFEAMSETIMDKKTDYKNDEVTWAWDIPSNKELNTLVIRALIAGLSTEKVAWVFKIPESAVHKIIREAL